MKPEKMTDEQVAEALRMLASGNAETRRVAADALRAHITALTSERDTLRAVVAERDALRERVQALEAEGERLRKLWNQDADAKIHAQNEATVRGWRLDAIRQRAGDAERLAKVAESCAIMGSLGSAGWDDDIHADVVARGAETMLRDAARGIARYVLGEDGAGAEPLHCCGTTTDTHRDGCPHAQVMASLAATFAKTEPQCSLHPGRKCDPETPGVFECSVSSPGRLLDTTPIQQREPSMAEAFATVRDALRDGYEHGEHAPGEHALSLLELRVGAMCVAIGYAGEALEHMGDVLNGMDAVDSDDPADAAAIRNYERFNALRATIDDAPPVFTLEEVDDAWDRAKTRMLGDDGIANLHEYIGEELRALRK